MQLSENMTHEKEFRVYHFTELFFLFKMSHTTFYCLILRESSFLHMYYFVSHSLLYFAFTFIAFIFVLQCHKRYPIFIMLTVGKVIDCETTLA